MARKQNNTVQSKQKITNADRNYRETGPSYTAGRHENGLAVVEVSLVLPKIVKHSIVI